MRLDLTDEQEQFRDITRRFLNNECPMTTVRDLWVVPSGYDPSYWARAAALGWTSLFAPKDHGGGGFAGTPTCDAAIVAEEIGRANAPGPFHAVNVCVAALTAAGSAAQLDQMLPGLLDGSSVLTWALAESGDSWATSDLATSIMPDGDELVITGQKTYVEAADSADQFLISGTTSSGISQVIVPRDATGVGVVAGRSVDIVRRFGAVSLDGVRVPRSCALGDLGGAAGAVERQRQIGIALLCAEMNGSARRAFEGAVQYAKDRHAFGRAIGSFQALKHRFADMLQRLEFSCAIADGLARAIDDDDPEAARLARVAKAYVSDACLDVIDDCVQMHGGIGVTWEHDIHIHSRRVALDRAVLGSPELHKESLAELLEIGR